MPNTSLQHFVSAAASCPCLSVADTTVMFFQQSLTTHSPCHHHHRQQRQLRPIIITERKRILVLLRSNNNNKRRLTSSSSSSSCVRVVFFLIVLLVVSLCSLQISVLQLPIVHGFHHHQHHQNAHIFPFAFVLSKNNRMCTTTTTSTTTSRSTTEPYIHHSTTSLRLSGPFYNVEVSSSSNILNNNNKNKNHFEYHPSLLSNRCQDVDIDSATNTNNNILSDSDHGNTNRTRDVTFLSPLLKYGYRIAVEEATEDNEEDTNGGSSFRKSDEKPLLLYLPGFDGTYLSPFLQFPELGTIFEVQCMSILTTDRSTFDELKQCVIEHLLQETIQHEQRQQKRQERLKEQERDKKQQQQQEQQQQFGSSGGLFGMGFFNPFGWWSSSDNNNTTAQNMTSITKSTTVLTSTTSGTANITTRSSTASNKGSSSSKNKDNKAILLGRSPSRPIYLAGESFGGILACEVALELLEKKQQYNINLQGLTLINPATCYDRSRLAVEAPLVAEQYHPILYPIGLLTKLLPLFLDEYSIRQLLLILQSKALPSVIDTPMREAYMGRVAFSLPFILEYMDQATLRWRLKEWLDVGCERMATKLRNFQKYGITAAGSDNNNNNFRPLPILIVAGEKDSALPSIAEAERLSSILPKTFLHVVEGAGHSSSCGSRVDLAALFRATYPELRSKPNNNKKKGNVRNNNNNSKRTNSKTTSTAAAATTANNMNTNRIAMKAVAAAGKNEYFGMEPRYDNSTTIGLSPLLYWNKDFYKKFRPPKIVSSSSTTTREESSTNSSANDDVTATTTVVTNDDNDKKQEGKGNAHDNIYW